MNTFKIAFDDDGDMWLELTEQGLFEANKFERTRHLPMSLQVRYKTDEEWVAEYLPEWFAFIPGGLVEMYGGALFIPNPGSDVDESSIGEKEFWEAYVNSTIFYYNYYAVYDMVEQLLEGPIVLNWFRPDGRE